MTIDARSVQFGVDGLVPGVVQDVDTGRVLMVGYLNAESISETEATGLVTFWSRSRNRLWQKGEASGNLLQVVDITADCDGDALLIQATPAGPTCHTGSTSCFAGEPLQGFAWLERLWRTIEARSADRPEGSYTAELLDTGPDGVARKVIEEAAEVAFAAKDDAASNTGRVAEEAADLVYHLLVLLRERRIDPAEVIQQLRSRAG